MLAVLFCLLSLLSLSYCVPVLEEDTTLTITGGADFSLPYKLYSDGDLRTFQWESISLTCTKRDVFQSFSSFASTHRPSKNLVHTTVVEDISTDLFGLLEIGTDGTLTWSKEIRKDFTKNRGNCGLSGGSVSWTVAI